MVHRRFRGPPEARFWAKVDKRGPDECWLWNAGVTRPGPHGYGRMQVSAKTKRLVVAHRYSWELVHGPVPEGFYVCHKCDVARCVNPAHLFLGTQKDNMSDASKKGRTYAQTHEIPKGDANLNTVVPDSCVVCMRLDRVLGGMTYSEIAEAYGLNPGTAYGLASGRARRHIPMPDPSLRAPAGEGNA
jgi:hypothetical protein